MKNYADQAKRRISRQLLTERFHFNSDYLCKVFKEKMGQTFRVYNENVYMYEAHRLICEEKRSVTEASERVGFSSRAQFYKVYRNYFPASE